MNLSTFRLSTALTMSVLLLSGCANPHHGSDTQQPLWQDHQDLAEELRNNASFSNYEAYISETLIDIITEDSASEDHSELFKQLAVPLWFESVKTHFEGAEEGNLCLVTNGISTEGDSISASTEYQREDGRFKIRAVEIQFLEDNSGFPQEIWCPVRPETFM